MLCEVTFFLSLSLTCSSLKHGVLLEILIQNSALYIYYLSEVMDEHLQMLIYAVALTC